MGPIIIPLFTSVSQKDAFPPVSLILLLIEPSLKLLLNLYSNYILKILEKVLTNCLSCHLLFHSLAFQFDYYTYHSTETTLLTIHNHVMASSDKGKVTAVVLLALSAAFDTINHRVLLHYLEHWFGLSDLTWFTSCLYSYTQSILISRHTSAPLS